MVGLGGLTRLVAYKQAFPVALGFSPDSPPFSPALLSISNVDLAARPSLIPIPEPRHTHDMGVQTAMVPAKEASATAAEEAPQFERVVWHKDPGLRKLYLVSCFGLMVASATTGYDGSLLNTVQQFDAWETYFNHVGTDPAQSSQLGLLTNMFTIGSILSMFLV
jgi:hypothetical protein